MLKHILVIIKNQKAINVLTSSSNIPNTSCWNKKKKKHQMSIVLLRNYIMKFCPPFSMNKCTSTSLTLQLTPMMGT